MRRRQHRLGHTRDGDNIVWGTSTTTTSSGARHRRRQHRLGHTSTGRQHRVGQRGADGRALLMEKMPYQEHADARRSCRAHRRRRRAVHDVDWRSGLPALTGALVTLRELRASDAPSLFVAADHRRGVALHLAAADDGRRLRELHRLDAPAAHAGQYVCFAIVPRGIDDGGRDVPGAFARAGVRHRRMGLRAGSEFWGTGHVRRRRAARRSISRSTCSARIGSKRARRCANGRGNGALRKLGAVQEGVLRRSFLRHGELSRSGAVDDPRRGLALSATVDAGGVARTDVNPLTSRRGHGRPRFRLRSSRLN